MASLRRRPSEVELGEPEREAIRGLFDGLEREVPILLELGPEETPVTVLVGGRELDFGAETQVAARADRGASGRVTLHRRRDR